MKWSIYVCLLVCLARYCSGGALRCPPSVTECIVEKKEITDTKVTSSHPSHTGPTTECLAGTVWESKCHFCRCLDTGVAQCLKNDNCEHGSYEEPYLCKPNTTFIRDCNKCLCLDNGMALCSMDYCSDTPQVINIKENDKTEPTKNSDKPDVAVPMALSSVNTTKSVVCEANRMFVKDCNTCWCNEDGTSYFCTRRVCVPLQPDEEPDLGGIPAEDLILTKKECRPDEVFEMDCNMCRCNPDGKSYSCTRKACIEQLQDNKNVTLTRKVRGLPTEPTKACQPGQEFRLDCNKCLCDNEGRDFSCTRNDCNALNNNPHASALTAPRSKRDTTDKVPTECVPGSVFDRDCNICRCTQDGSFAVCTLRACLKQNEVDHVSESENGFRCNAGEQFKQECNDCTCSADGKSVFCTLRLCDQDLTPDI